MSWYEVLGPLGLALPSAVEFLVLLDALLLLGKSDALHGIARSLGFGVLRFLATTVGMVLFAYAATEEVRLSLTWEDTDLVPLSFALLGGLWCASLAFIGTVHREARLKGASSWLTGEAWEVALRLWFVALLAGSAAALGFVTGRGHARSGRGMATGAGFLLAGAQVALQLLPNPRNTGSNTRTAVAVSLAAAAVAAILSYASLTVAVFHTAFDTEQPQRFLL